MTTSGVMIICSIILSIALAPVAQDAHEPEHSAILQLGQGKLAALVTTTTTTIANLQEENEYLQEQNHALQAEIDRLLEQIRSFQEQQQVVKAAGYNHEGELGISENSGTEKSNPRPLRVASLGTDVVAVSGGQFHSIYVMKNGSVRAAGGNGYGQLGDSENSGVADPNPTPLEVSSLGTDVVAASAGHMHTVYLMKDGSVRAAGYNQYGQLGVSENSGASVPNPIPLEVPSLGKDVAAISAGAYHTVYLMKDGSVRAAGGNYNGQLGVSESSGGTDPNPAPLEIPSLGTEVAAISAGSSHTVYLMKDGSVRAAGSNNRGQLGVSENSGGIDPNPTPVEVPSLGANVAAISAGSSHTVYLMKDGSVRAAGGNYYGQLGDSENSGGADPNPTPLEVSSLGTEVRAVSAGGSHTLYLMKDGSVRAAGYNQYGQLGVPENSNTGNPNPTPLEVPSLGAEVAAVAAGHHHSLFLVRQTGLCQ